MSGPICYGHCFLEFPDNVSFNEHIARVIKQRERRQKRYQYNKLKKELNIK